ncbi:MAG: glycosyltransferase [Nitrososphaeraceae archaeon]
MLTHGWTGKTWACYQGYIHSTGNILLFTDADTTHSHCTLSLSFQYFLSNKLNALTLVLRLRSEDFWTRLILPVLWTLSYARYSPQKANDPGTRNGGYFFGSFFMISRDTYEAIGTHERVRAEIVEDVELGRMVKELGLRSQVVRGEHHVTSRFIMGWTKKTNDSHVSERKGKCYSNYHQYISHAASAIYLFNNLDYVEPCLSFEY